MSKIVSLSSLKPSHLVLRKKLQGKDLTRVDQRDCAKEEEKKLREACSEFEALFIYMVMKQMRKTIPQTKLIDGGKGEEIFTSMMDEELSRQMSLRQGLGLKDVLVEQLSGKRKGVLPRSIVNETYSKNHSLEEYNQPFTLPVFGSVSSPYGWRKEPFSGERDFHHGIDITGPSGSEVYAAGEGRVVFSGWREGYGRVVEVEHQDGLSTLYAHNAKNLVKEGDWVARYHAIALLGNSGRSTGPHLHFEVRRNGEAFNPTKVTHFSKGRWYANRF
jgi:murein DD-endopeptidase MepM/ murein hydrolase activator NlpD